MERERERERESCSFFSWEVSSGKRDRSAWARTRAMSNKREERGRVRSKPKWRETTRETVGELFGQLCVCVYMRNIRLHVARIFNAAKGKEDRSSVCFFFFCLFLFFVVPSFFRESDKYWIWISFDRNYLQVLSIPGMTPTFLLNFRGLGTLKLLEISMNQFFFFF